MVAAYIRFDDAEKLAAEMSSIATKLAKELGNSFGMPSYYCLALV
jgi:hypothetical protein